MISIQGYMHVVALPVTQIWVNWIYLLKDCALIQPNFQIWQFKSQPWLPSLMSLIGVAVIFLTDLSS